ncbi:MAG: hypothetical protein ACR2P6_01735 [Gammaproteobacteria bacterium]
MTLRFIRKRSPAQLLLAILYFWSSGSSAAAWDWGTDFGASARYIDNASFLPNGADKVDTFSSSYFARAKFVRLAPQSTIELKPRITTDLYPENDELEETNFYFEVNTSRKLGLSNLNANIRYNNVGVLSSVLDDTTGDTEVRVGDRKEYFAIFPTLTRTLGQRSTFNIGASYSKTDFDETFSNNADSDNFSVRAGYNYLATPRQTVGITASYLVNESTKIGSAFLFNSTTGNLPIDDANACNDPLGRRRPPTDDPNADPVEDCALSLVQTDIDSNVTGVNLTYNFIWTSATSINLSLGMNFSSSDFKNTALNPDFSDEFGLFNGNTISNDSDNTAYGLGITHNAPTRTYNFTVSQRIAPVDTGGIRTTNRAQFDFENEFNSRLRLILKMSANDSDSPGEQTTIENKNFRGQISLARNFTTHLNIVGSYTYRWSERPPRELGDVITIGNTITRESNQISLSLVYNIEKSK